MSRLTTVRTPPDGGPIFLGCDAPIFFSNHPMASVAGFPKLLDSLLPFGAGRPIVTNITTV